MNLIKYKELQLINDNASLLGMNVILSYSELSGIWDTALYLNRISNKAENDEVIRSFELIDEESNTLHWFNVKGRHKFTRMQFAIILISYSCYLTKQQINKLLTKTN